MSGHGRFFWCVKVPVEVAEDGEIYVAADGLHVNRDGSLVLVRRAETGERVNLVIAAGSWYAVYAASWLDGAPVAITHWVNELVPVSPSFAWGRSESASPTGDNRSEVDGDG